MRAIARPGRYGVVDVGGTSMRQAVVDLAHGSEPVVRTVTSIPTPADPAAAVRQVLDLGEAAAAGVDAVGVVVPGVVDDRTGAAVWSENIGWRDVALRDLLAERVAVPVSVGHDVRAWGLAEQIVGAARGVTDCAIVVVGTGIAAALVADGRPVAGRGYAGEIGHLQVADGPECACGGRGCLEAVASAAAIARTYSERAGRPVSGSVDVAALVADGDPVARRVWDDAVDHLSTALATLTVVTAPELIVVGGGLARSGELLLEPLRRRLHDRLTYTPAPRLTGARFDGTGGLVGAALQAATNEENA